MGDTVTPSGAVHETQASSPVLLTLRFPFDQAHLQPQHHQALESAAAHLRQSVATAGGKPLVVAGFTDDIGPRQYNDALARRRAENVAVALRALGITSLHIEANGKCCYAATNDTAAGRALNRRVDIRLPSPQDTPKERAR